MTFIPKDIKGMTGETNYPFIEPYLNGNSAFTMPKLPLPRNDL